MRTQRCAVLGDPISHSLSPALHNAGYEALGLDFRYDAFRVPEGGLRDFLGDLEGERTWRGLSVTMPLKREALVVADRATDRATAAGTANTLMLNAPTPIGRLVVADNTDVPGAVAAIRERSSMEISAATILGGGATATSLGHALCELGARRLRLLVRSKARAVETVESLRRHPTRPEVDVDTLQSGRVVGQLAASTIPAEAQTPTLVQACAQVPIIFEVTYHPWPTPLAASVEEDRVLVSGLDLLVHQAALQFEIFTELPAPMATMRTAGEAALAARTRVSVRP